MTLIYFFLILGITVTIHEFGHFLFAKRAGIYCYEFSIGMGPIIKQWRRKNDETVYSIRLLPIGGYVSMAGEQLDEDDKVPKKQRLQNKTWLQRFSTIIAGIVFNFILAIVIFFVIGLLNGVPSSYMHITSIEDGLPAASTKLAVDDVIKKVNGKTTNADLLMLELTMNEGKEITLTVEKPDGRKIDVDIKPKKQEDGTFRYGFGLGSDVKKGLFAAVGYGFTKTWSLIVQMANIIFYLFTGKMSLNSLSGPVGIYNVVGQSAEAGLLSLLYLLAYISVNVGFINLLPIPAFDGGRILFLIIEKIIGRPVSPKVENAIHAVGMIFLLALMVLITFNDIAKLFMK